LNPPGNSRFIICGIDELSLHNHSGVSHILSFLDPDSEEPGDLLSYGQHDRTVLRFHDAIQAVPGIVLPDEAHVETILEFGRSLRDSIRRGHEPLVLIHCIAGVSRSTAAAAILLAQLNPEQAEDAIFAQVATIRPKAWPNSRLIGIADNLLVRQGRFNTALGKFYLRQLTMFPRTAGFMTASGLAGEVAIADRSDLTQPNERT
jgi:predicted protein tyrosine phosphatase